MELLVIVLCLLSERFLIHSISYHRFSWFEHYNLSIQTRMNKYSITHNSPIMLLCIVVPIILIAGLIYLVVVPILFGFLWFLVNIVIFFYCLGPQNPFYPLDTPGDSQENSVGTYFSEVNNQLFAVIFWYIIGGPIAILAFRLISLSENISSIGHLAKEVTEILEWIPARLTVLLYLFVGNFQAGFKYYIQFLGAKPALNDQMLNECGLLAAGENETVEVTLPVAERLVEHAVIMLLAFIALVTIL